MKKIFGLAALVGVAAGAAYYMKKIGALNLSEEEEEDGSLKYGVEVKLPTARTSAPETEDTEEVEDLSDEEVETEIETDEDFSDEEEQEDGERKFSFYVTVGPEAREKIKKAKNTVKEMKDAVLQKAAELKDAVVTASDSEDEEPEDEEEYVDGYEIEVDNSDFTESEEESEE